MTSTWPRRLPRKSHLEKFKFTIFVGQVHFWCKCNRYKPVTFKITCQSSQGHLLSKKSIDFLRHCSCLLGKVKGKSFKCKLTGLYLEILDISGSNAKSMEIWYLVPSELIYVLQRTTELNFWLKPTLS